MCIKVEMTPRFKLYNGGSTSSNTSCIAGDMLVAI